MARNYGRAEWTPEELQRLRELWPDNPDRRVIADLMGRSLSSILAKASIMGLPSEVKLRKNPLMKTSVRPCMTCGKDFVSEGIHNRVCGGCKSTSDWISP